MSVLKDKMLLAILLTCIASAASKITTHCSTCIKVNNICHNTTYLFTINAHFRDKVVITKLGVLRSENVLFYAFEPKISDQEYYKVGYVNLDGTDAKNNYSVVTTHSGNINNFNTFDFDQDNNTVYLGGSDGIGFIDATGKAVLFSTRGDTIINVFVYQRNIFFTRKGENKIVEKTNDDKFKTYEDYRNVKNFIIDKSNNLVFLNTSGLFVNRFKTNQTMFLSKNNYIRGLTMDLDGVVYAWWVDGIYKVIIEPDLADSALVKIADIPSIGGVTFDNDNNFLFTSGAGLFRLTPTNVTVGC